MNITTLESGLHSFFTASLGLRLDHFVELLRIGDARHLFASWFDIQIEINGTVRSNENVPNAENNACV